jgi:phosphate-selective porin OprO/OprP
VLKKQHLTRALILAALLAPPAAQAGSAAMLEVLQILKDKKTIDQATYERLKLSATADDEKTTGAIEQIKKTVGSVPVLKDNGFEFSSQDGNFDWRFGGRLHLDGTFYDNNRKSAMVSGVDARRARFEVQGTMYKRWLWKLDYEFGQTDQVKDGFRDAYIRYTFDQKDFPTFISVGQFKEFLGLEHANSSNDLPFVERALPSRVFHDVAEASDGRRMGVTINTRGHDLWTTAFGVFGRNTSGSSTDTKDDPFSMQGRVTFSPIHTKDAAIHFGGSGNWINLNSPDRVQFASRPEARLGAQRFLDTGVIPMADDMLRFGLETGAIFGPLWLQGEYLAVEVQRPALRDTLGFSGGHGEVGWIFSGESRGYDFAKGTFTNPRPRHNVGEGGWGAWELAVRYSYLDLTDRQIHAGRETNGAVGINWYLNPNYRLMFTYDRTLDIEGGKFARSMPGTVLLRAQANW